MAAAGVRLQWFLFAAIPRPVRADTDSAGLASLGARLGPGTAQRGRELPLEQRPVRADPGRARAGALQLPSDRQCRCGALGRLCLPCRRNLPRWRLYVSPYPQHGARRTPSEARRTLRPRQEPPYRELLAEARQAVAAFRRLRLRRCEHYPLRDVGALEPCGRVSARRGAAARDRSRAVHASADLHGPLLYGGQLHRESRSEARAGRDLPLCRRLFAGAVERFGAALLPRRPQPDRLGETIARGGLGVMPDHLAGHLRGRRACGLCHGRIPASARFQLRLPDAEQAQRGDLEICSRLHAP